VLYLLLHGDEVFSEEHQFARLIGLIKEKEPSFDRGLESQGDVSAALFRLVRQLLQKESNHRPSTIRDVAETLGAISSRLTASPDAPLHGYIATALTGLSSDAKEAISFASAKVAEVCKEFGIYVYQPRKATDPLANPNIKAEAVYHLDRKRVLGANLLIVLANYSSFGAGQEIEIATAAGTPTLLIRRADLGEISRMVTGSFLNLIDEVVTYSNPEDIERKLRRCLHDKIEVVRALTLPAARSTSNPLGARLVELREARGLSLAEAAIQVGVSSRLLNSLEKHPVWYHNVGLHVLERVARVYGSTIGDLIGSAPLPSVPKGEDANVHRLETVASQLDMTAKDFLRLRREYMKERAAHGASVAVSESDWMARYDALQRSKVQQRSQGELPL
jgi:transcriptional regulator with XRE-family HTH domain